MDFCHLSEASGTFFLTSVALKADLRTEFFCDENGSLYLDLKVQIMGYSEPSKDKSIV